LADIFFGCIFVPICGNFFWKWVLIYLLGVKVKAFQNIRVHGYGCFKLWEPLMNVNFGFGSVGGRSHLRYHLCLCLWWFAWILSAFVPCQLLPNHWISVSTCKPNSQVHVKLSVHFNVM
jgi:hypothetical protein